MSTTAAAVPTTVGIGAPGAAAAGSGKFAWEDYTVFGLSLALTLLIGLVFAIVDKWHKQSAESYLMGDRNMHFLPVAMSMLASTLNAVFVVGGVAEVHYFGMEGILLVVGYLVGTLVGIFFIIPVFHSMGFQFTSAYEYFERRFHLVVRMVGSLVFVVGILIFLAVVLYAPSIAFTQVSHIENEYLTIFFTGAVCAFYTAFGGLKAVVWTDTVQMIILLASMLALTVVGLDKAGGLQHSWEIFASNTSMRQIVNDVRIDFYERHSIWTTCFAYGLLWACVLGSNQMMIQRYMSVKTKLQAQLAKMIGWVLLVFMFVLVTLISIAGYAKYSCDPIVAGKLGGKGDRLLPYFLMDTMSSYKGFPGLVVAGFYAAALSTVSSCINSLAAVFLEDFVKPIYRMSKGRKMAPSTSGLTSRILGIIFGVVSVAIAMAAPSMAQLLVPLIVNAYAIMGAPLFGVFILGWFFPCAESVGALVGLLVSLAAGLYFFLTNTLYGTRIGWHQKAIRLNCSKAILSKLKRLTPFPPPGINELSYLWGAPIMLAICVLLGLLVSVIVNCAKGKVTCRKAGAHLDPRLLISCGDNCCCCLGGSCVKDMRCGIDHGDNGRIFCRKHQQDKDTGVEKVPGVENAAFDHSLRQDYENGDMTKL